MLKAISWASSLLLLTAVASAQEASPTTPPNPAPKATETKPAKPGDDKGSDKEGRVEVAGASGSEASAAKELTTVANTAELEYRVGVVEVDRREVKEVALAVDPLVDDKGRQYPVRWGLTEPREQDYAVIAKPLPPSTRRTVILRATLPDLGAYSMSITPYWGGTAHQKIVLKVTRARPTLSLDVSEPSVFAQDGDTDVAHFSLTLRETDGRKLVLGYPVVTSLVQMRGADAKAISLAKTVSQSVSVDGKSIDGGASIEFAPGASKNVQFSLDKLPGPGRYDAKVRFTSQDSAVVDKTITIYVRAHPLVAAFFILWGVLVSSLLKWWVSKEQPRVELLKQARRLVPDLDEALRPGDLDEAERRLGEDTRNRLGQLLSDIKEGTPKVNSDSVEAMAVRVSAVRNWIAVHSSVRRIELEPVRRSFLDKLDPIEADLANPDVDTTKLKDHQAALRRMPSEIHAAVRKGEIEVQADKLAGELPQAQAETMKREVQDCLNRNDMDAAEARLRKEEAAILAKRVADRAATGTPMGADDVEAERAALSLAGTRGFEMPALAGVLKLTDAQIERAKRTEFFIFLTILFIAVVLGMKALYADDLTWGGWASWVTAFLWGLGLHQFTYGGVGSVLDKVAKSSGST